MKPAVIYENGWPDALRYEDVPAVALVALTLALATVTRNINRLAQCLVER